MILDDILKFKKEQLNEEKKGKGKFKKALSGDRMSVIAEIKKASPSKGIIKEDFDPSKIAEIYKSADVDAISVLTEKKFFKGDDKYIKDVKDASGKPVLRKDFIIDEYQIYQSKMLGADAILLIAAVLCDKLKYFYDKAKSIGLDCLVEVHNKNEIDEAVSAGCDIIGINNRDLRDFSVNLNTTEKLIKYIPEDKIKVSESGIKTPDDIKYLKNIGIDAVLIGETFMRNTEDSEKIQSFVKKAKEI